VDAKPRLGLSHWLSLLVICTTVPLVLFAGAALYQMSRDARAARDQGQANTVQALALAVDGEVRAWKAVVTALAESQSIRPDRLAEFYEEARRVAAPHDGWVVLTVASGDQLLNTLRPYGAPLARTSSPETIDAIFRDGKPIVSDVFYGQNAQRYVVAVAVPVVRSGKVVNCLTLNFSPQRLSKLLQGQQLPLTWTAAINDRQGRVVARSQLIEQRIGKPTVAWLVEAIRTAERGIATGPLTDGRMGQVAFRRLQEVPWTVTMSMPVAEIPSARPVLWYTLFGVLLGLVAVGVALFASRRITAPIGRLTANAPALAKGDVPDLGGPLPLRELQELHQALVEASATAQALQREQERAAAAEERAKAAATAAQVSREHAQALQESEERFRMLFASATDAIIVTDPAGAGRVLAVNPAACRLFGYTEAEFIGLTREAIIDTTGAQVAPMLQTREQTGRAIAEITYKRKDGMRFTGELTSAFIHPPGGTRRAVAIIRDITERKQAEAALRESQARLEAVFAAIPDVILEYDAGGKPVRANEAALRAIGLSSLNFTRDQAVAKLRFTHLDGSAVRSEDLPTSRALQGEIVAGDLYVVRTADESGRVISTYAAPLCQDGKVSGVVALWHDVTALKRAEEGLRTAHVTLEQRVQERTAELSRALQQLSAQSEQLRSLASELTLVEQRERLRLAEQIHDGLQQLLVAARLKVNLLGHAEATTIRQTGQEIGQLLDEAVVDSRSLTAELSPPILRTGGLFAGLEWLARWSAEKYHLIVHVQGPAAPVPPLPEDFTVLLFQSVRELLFNAVKYAKVPEATVTLAWDPPGLTLTVADAGAGFDPHGLRGEGGGGGGFGLARIRHRLELLGGCMTLDSAPGQGTRVTLAVRLPTAALPVATPAPPQPTAAPQPVLGPAPETLRKTRILVVDDHQVVRRALAQLLRAEADLTVVGEAGTGTAAVALARQLSPDVVLMDINMPEINGIDATRAIHAAFPAIRVIGLSMFDRGDQQAAMQDAGAVAYVSKSAPAEELLSAIRAAVRTAP
jgi:PAS domain S-box-containing protein